MSSAGPSITEISTAVYRFPTPEPEADGTLQWDATTAVTVTLRADDKVGLGWTYSAGAAAEVIQDKLATAIEGLTPSISRTVGRPCIAPAAIWGPRAS